ncbi:MAG: lipid-A-disaccharide synthase N-terminal domain-containing protein [Phycisphaerae bacterium]
MLAATGSEEFWTPWLIVGFIGQFIFGLRFVVQWIATERAKRSVVPVAFWYLSLLGTVITLTYAIYRLDPVFIASFSLNLIIYVRNLYFIHRKPPVGETAEPSAEARSGSENQSSSS